MDRELAKRWVSALRSGKYTQTDSVLHDDRGYCCLGVLMEIVYGDPYDGPDEDRDYRGDEELGADRLYDVGMTGSQENQFILMNDRQGYSFAEIADEIEKIYLK